MAIQVLRSVRPGAVEQLAASFTVDMVRGWNHLFYNWFLACDQPYGQLRKQNYKLRLRKHSRRQCRYVACLSPDVHGDSLAPWRRPPWHGRMVLFFFYLDGWGGDWWSGGGGQFDREVWHWSKLPCLGRGKTPPEVCGGVDAGPRVCVCRTCALGLDWFFGERQPLRWTSGHFSFYSFPFNGSVVFGEQQPLRRTSGHFCLKNYGSGMFGERLPLRWTSGRLGHVGPTRSREMLEPAAFGPTWASEGGSVISAQLVGWGRASKILQLACLRALSLKRRSRFRTLQIKAGPLCFDFLMTNFCTYDFFMPWSDGRIFNLCFSDGFVTCCHQLLSAAPPQCFWNKLGFPWYFHKIPIIRFS